MLDQVTDPRNLGAVCRSADGAGATGVIVPAHGSAVVTPAVARSSAGAIEHLPIAVVTNLARYLEEVKGAELWVYGAAAKRRASMWETDLSGGVALVFGAEGRGLRPLVERSCDALVSIPTAGAVESLNVSVAAALLLYEARRQRIGVGHDRPDALPLRRLQPPPRRPFTDRSELVDALASFVAMKGARGIVVFDGVGDDVELGPARGALRARRRHAARAPRGRAPRREQRRCRLLRCDGARHRGARGRKLSVADLLARARSLRPAHSRRPPRSGLPRTSSTSPRRARGSSGSRARRVSGSSCKRACLFWAMLLDLPQPKGETLKQHR